ncbi:hypothetical protein INT46_001617 [Mucor plumbeus]|uniref:Uncharacterized protein n=1 Tax=Mucor plumbeus TaxID=97098 RepID=A0A8H7V5Z2_9FUNG|nr:hypothetical protein INT46_001617 [Mucor plumbeus]
MRVDDSIYCTVKRRTGECFEKFASSKGSSTSFRNHLEHKHSNLIESRHNIILKLLMFSKETLHNWENKTGREKEVYTDNFVQSCLTPENKPHLDKYQEEQEEIDAVDEEPNTRETFLTLFTDFIVANRLPMSFSENIITLEKLIQFSNRNRGKDSSKSYNPMLILPKRNKLKDLIIQKYIDEKEVIKSTLQEQEFLNFTTDLWKSDTNKYFMGITAHYIDKNWQPQQITIANKHMKNASHSGKDLGNLFLAVLDDYGIKSKLFCITTDNASNNGSMAEYIEKVAEKDLSFSFNREENMISCFAHVINLVCHNLIEKGLKARAPNDSANMEAVMKDIEKNGSENDNPIDRLRKGC